MLDRLSLFDDIAQTHPKFPCYRIMLTLLKVALTLIRSPLPSPLASANTLIIRRLEPPDGPRMVFFPLLFAFFQGRTGETGSLLTASSATQSVSVGAVLACQPRSAGRRWPLGSTRIARRRTATPRRAGRRWPRSSSHGGTRAASGELTARKP